VGEKGLIRALAAAALLALAACATEAPTYRDLERAGRDYEDQGVSPLAERGASCGANQHTARIGTALADWTPPTGARVIRPGTPVTRDFHRERLSVIVDAEGRITALECY
jgi:hypothetical protein